VIRRPRPTPPSPPHKSLVSRVDWDKSQLPYLSEFTRSDQCVASIALSLSREVKKNEVINFLSSSDLLFCPNRKSDRFSSWLSSSSLPTGIRTPPTSSLTGTILLAPDEVPFLRCRLAKHSRSCFSFFVLVASFPRDLAEISGAFSFALSQPPSLRIVPPTLIPLACTVGRRPFPSLRCISIGSDASPPHLRSVVIIPWYDSW